jgi:hypothetical protein
MARDQKVLALKLRRFHRRRKRKRKGSGRLALNAELKEARKN